MPARAACRRGCRSATSPTAARLLAETTIRTSTDVYFRERMPWRIGTVALDAGPSIVAHLHGDLREGEQGPSAIEARQEPARRSPWRCRQTDTPQHGRRSALARDHLRSQVRRVLITDGRTAVGPGAGRRRCRRRAPAWSSSASPIPGSRFPARTALRKIERVEIVPLDLTDTDLGQRVRRRIAARVDILSTPPSTCAPAASSTARA